MKMSQPKKTLLLLYASPDGLSEASLGASIEVKKVSGYRRDVLRRPHNKAFINYDEASTLAHLSPTGTKEVEKNILGSV